MLRKIKTAEHTRPRADVPMKGSSNLLAGRFTSRRIPWRSAAYLAQFTPTRFQAATTLDGIMHLNSLVLTVAFALGCR